VPCEGSFCNNVAHMIIISPVSSYHTALVRHVLLKPKTKRPEGIFSHLDILRILSPSNVLHKVFCCFVFKILPTHQLGPGVYYMYQIPLVTSIPKTVSNVFDTHSVQTSVLI